MAVSISENDGDDDFAESHEINVTPFIDVMLVLLIIFMVAAPLSTVDLPIDLPTSSATPQKKPDKPVYMTVKPDLTLAIGNVFVPRDRVQSALGSATAGNKDTVIFLRADKTVPYGELIEAMNILSKAGYLKIALVGLEKVSAP